MSGKIEMNRKYRTRDGREVRIYAVGCGGPYPVHGAKWDGERWRLEMWEANGAYAGPSDRNADLIEVKPTITRTVWIRHYRCDCTMDGSVWNDEFQAKNPATMGEGLIAITGPHEITFTEGDGLSEAEGL